MSVLHGVRCDEGKTQRGGQRRASSPRHMQGIRKTPADVRPLFVSVVSHRDQSDRAEFGDEPQDLLAVHDDERSAESRAAVDLYVLALTEITIRLLICIFQQSRAPRSCEQAVVSQPLPTFPSGDTAG